MTGFATGDRHILGTIGNTPLVRLQRMAPARTAVEVLAKLEGTNPGGSVKDRAAWFMIRGAVERGELKPGMTIVEPTSGNTGIALAMIASMTGWPIELVMPASATRERVLTMQAFGAKVTLTPAGASMEGAIDYARARVADGGAWMLDQFSNPDNPRAHFEGTGPEIWRDTDGRVTHFVSSMGTTGTIMGCSAWLKAQNTEIEIVGVQPGDGACIPGIRRWPAAYLPRIYDHRRVDRIMDVTQTEAEETARRLARDEGIFCGASGGGAVAAALAVAAQLDRAVVVVIIPDRGDRYLSTPLFDGREEPA